MASKKNAGSAENVETDDQATRDELKAAVDRATKLMRLADNDPDSQESRTAAVQLVKHMKDHDLVLVPRAHLERQAQVVGEAAQLAEKAKKEQLTNMMIGGALGFVLGGGKFPKLG